MKNSNFVLGAVFLIFSACYSGPALKNKTAYLDGDNYSATSVTGGVPLYLETKSKKTTLEGDVFGKGLTGLPLNGVNVVLRDKNKRILKQMKTDNNGRYKFYENLNDGDYSLEFEYKNKIQKRMVPLKGYHSKVLRVYFN